ncbi:TRAP transporter substrate-binding protein [Actinoplanes sp. NPDC023801]|uniref:TRAP transporter substrate-binding protein n=1 Tax=Actinoplanes sp. NPDC023801 TaxID=3154595 RepID=UPI003404229B
MGVRRIVVSSIAVASLLAGGMSAPAAAVPGKPRVTLRVVTPFAAGHVLADTAYRFEDLVERRSHGRIQVEVATSVLNEQTIDPAMVPCAAADRVGDVLLTGGQPIQDYAPAYFFFNGPYVIRDYEHFRRVWASHLGKEARQLIAAKGNLTTLGTAYRGFRQFTANRPITGPADLSGLALRLPPVPDWVTVWSSLGTRPVQVPLPGIYDALRSGTAEASEGDLTQIRSLRLNEVQSHLSLTSHLVSFGMVAANTCFLNDLTPRNRALVRQAVRQATDWATGRIATDEEALLAELGQSMQIVTPDAAAVRAAARPAIDGLFATKWNVTTWDEVLSY